MHVDPVVARPSSGHIAARLHLARAATARCLVDRLDDVLDAPTPPWAPDRWEDWDAEPPAGLRGPEPALEPGWERLLAHIPRRHHRAGSLLLCPPSADGRCERALVLVSGRLRVFRVTDEGKAETTAVLNPGALVVLGRPRRQVEDEAYVEALDAVAVCELSGQDARRVTERLTAAG